MLINDSVRRVLGLALGVLAGGVVLMDRPLRGDELLLQNGGRVRGSWLNAAEDPPKRYRFMTAAGVRLEFAADRVLGVRRTGETEREYARRVEACEDTPTALWELAEWCREQGLKEARRVHLQRIIELEPDHERARRGLGYSQVDGRWVTQESFFRERGYQQRNGRWVSPQEAFVLDQQEQKRRREKTWYQKLKRSRKQLAAGSREAGQVFANLRDPDAVWGLVKLWAEDPSPYARRAYVATLSEIETPASLAATVRISLTDPDEDVYRECAKRIKREASPEIIGLLVRTLKSPNNFHVNRAARTLAELDDDSTIDALIEALVTNHFVVIGKGHPDQISSTFRRDSDGGSLGSMQTGAKTNVIRQAVPNQGVLDALATMTGQSFGFKQRAWKAWWDNQRTQRVRQMSQTQGLRPLGRNE